MNKASSRTFGYCREAKSMRPMDTTVAALAADLRDTAQRASQRMTQSRADDAESFFS